MLIFCMSQLCVKVARYISPLHIFLLQKVSFWQNFQIVYKNNCICVIIIVLLLSKENFKKLKISSPTRVLQIVRQKLIINSFSLHFEPSNLYCHVHTARLLAFFLFYTYFTSGFFNSTIITMILAYHRNTMDLISQWGLMKCIPNYIRYRFRYVHSNLDMRLHAHSAKWTVWLPFSWVKFG